MLQNTMSSIERRREILADLRRKEELALAQRSNVAPLRGLIATEERRLHEEACVLARLTGQPPPPPLLTPTGHRPGDPPTPDRRPLGHPARGPGQFPWYRNCYDPYNYPQDEYSEERAQALSPNQPIPWSGGHYIPGAEVKVKQSTPGGPTTRFHDPPFVQHGHPAHVSETKVVLHNGTWVRVWADGVTPHS